MAKGKNIVTPAVRFEGDELNILESFFEGPEEDRPALKSIGFWKLPTGGRYISYVLTSKGEKIIKIDDVSEPDTLAVVIENAKRAFVEHLMDPQWV